MKTSSAYAAVVLGLTWLAGNAGHETGDYLTMPASTAGCSWTRPAHKGLQVPVGATVTALLAARRSR
jgi:hypothetical protein